MYTLPQVNTAANNNKNKKTQKDEKQERSNK